MKKEYEFYCLGKGGKSKVIIDNGKLTIIRPGLVSKLSMGFMGEKTILISNITSVQFKPYKFAPGYIQFTIAGEIAKKVGALNSDLDENIIYFEDLFGSKYNEKAKEIKEYIEEFNYNQNNMKVVQNVKSPIEQVKELKELLDIGAISQEEFDKKKKDIINL